MSRLLTAVLLTIAVALSGVPAQAGGYHYKSKPYGYGGYYHGYKSQYKSHHRKHYRSHRHYSRHRHYHHRRHGGVGDEILLGAGIIGGSIIVGSLLSQPRPAPPPATVYYAPPPAPYCVQDQVYRYLPDGSIQWGTRTRCY
ncbi:MAG: hypothetical protein GEU89_20275 [Kiloniellaceae bacterium]|nr:hypothetical protein [Kiloniellaceae bacterium]